MRGLKKTHEMGTDKQTDGHVDSLTNSAQRAKLVKTKHFTRQANVFKEILLIEAKNLRNKMYINLVITH